MPKVIGYTPPWLSRPSPGARIFSDPETQSPASPSKRSSYLGSPPSTDYQGPRRLVASRGTEIFTVVGNKIRWADLARVKDQWEDSSHRGPSYSGAGDGLGDENSLPYRSLVTSVYYQIRQIVISPSGTFLAICTEHTVHVAVLPDSSRLADGDRSPLKLKTYQLGPTIHVIPESPLASVLWHPLAVATSSTDCLVTVTAEAAVRVWELDRSNHWTFERPELAIDLRKLADAVSCDQDFEPCGFGKTRGFSVDDFDMEVSAACFGGRAGEQEDAWASMTLWTAMRNGDIYALCPLLPSKWTPTSTTIPSLTTSAVSRMASIAAEDADADDRRAADQQYEWVQEIDDEDPLLLDASDPSERYEVRLRPQNPSAIPRLQGPFELPMEDEAIDIEVSDIFVFPSHLEVEDILSGEDDYEEWGTATPTGIPFTTVCLASTDNKVYFALELEGVSCQWLPKKGRSTFSLPSSDARELPLVESVILDGTLPGHASSSWPVFTGDPVHSHSLFFTTATQIYSLSLNEWITRLAVELSGDGPADPALKTRLDTSCQSQICVADKVIEINESPKAPLSAPTLVDDAYLGYFMLTCTPTTAYSAFFDQSHLRESIANPWSPERTSTSLILAQSQLDRITAEEEAEDGGINLPTRAPYAPSNVLYANATHPLRQLRDRIPANHKKAMTERPMRLSPACLDVMTSAHRTIAVQTAELEQAAAELFRRCERLRDELGDQVKQMSELADRLQHLHGLTHDGDDDRRSHEARIREAQERQHRLVQRYEVLRRKVGRVGTARQELSSKEVAWIEEIETLGRNVGVVEPENEKVPAPLDSRFDTVKNLARELLAASRQLEKQQAEQTAKASNGLEPSDSSPSRRSPFTVSSRLQKEKIADVMAMVEREGAIIDAAMSRLERLNIED